MVAAAERQLTLTWRASAEIAVRKLAAITVAGTLIGLLVGGVGGRLAMMLLAVLNDRATGVTSDDGFAIGQFTIPGTAQLLGATWQLGLLGAFAYALLRGLMLGPLWFRVMSMALGSGVVVAAVIVHTGGVDFELLHPVPLTVGLFVAIPVLFVALLTLVAERWLAAERWPCTGHIKWVLVTLLLLWLPLLPLLPVLAGGWLLSEWLRRRPEPRALRPVVSWLTRALLAVVFVFAVADLVSDVRILAYHALYRPLTPAAVGIEEAATAIGVREADLAGMVDAARAGGDGSLDGLDPIRGEYEEEVGVLSHAVHGVEQREEHLAGGEAREVAILGLVVDLTPAMVVLEDGDLIAPSPIPRSRSGRTP